MIDVLRGPAEEETDGQGRVGLSAGGWQQLPRAYCSL